MKASLPRIRSRTWIRSTRWAAAAVCAWVLSASAPALATPTVFGELFGVTGTPFSFTFVGPGATLSGTTSALFNFQGLAGAPTGDQAVTVTLTSTAVTPATASGPFLSQPIDGPTNVLKIIRTLDSKNILTVGFTGILAGQAGTPTATLFSATSSGNTVAFTSDFLNFSGTPVRTMSLVFPSITPTLSQAGNGFLTNFTSNAFASFTTDPLPLAVPEPASVGLFGLGLGMAGLVGYRGATRRNRA